MRHTDFMKLFRCSRLGLSGVSLPRPSAEPTIQCQFRIQPRCLPLNQAENEVLVRRAALILHGYGRVDFKSQFS